MRPAPIGPETATIMRSCHRCLLVATPYSGTIIRTWCCCQRQRHTFRTKASLPSLPMRNTDRHAGTFRTCVPPAPAPT